MRLSMIEKSNEVRMELSYQRVEEGTFLSELLIMMARFDEDQPVDPKKIGCQGAPNALPPEEGSFMVN